MNELEYRLYDQNKEILKKEFLDFAIENIIILCFVSNETDFFSSNIEENLVFCYTKWGVM